MNIVDEGPEDHEEDVLHEICCADLDISQLNEPLRVSVKGRGGTPIPAMSGSAAENTAHVSGVTCAIT
jgi:hypothetical protein